MPDPDPDEALMIQWVVYHLAKDQKAPWSARRWIVTRHGAVPTDDMLFARTLEALRTQLPDEVDACLSRMPEDDEAIYEVWI